MTSLIPIPNMSQNPPFDSDMVAEQAVIAGSLGDINMMAAGPDPATPFDLFESERKVNALTAIKLIRHLRRYALSLRQTCSASMRSLTLLQRRRT